MKYIFNIILSIIYFAVASVFASKCNNEIIEVVMWLFLTAWCISFIFFLQGIERNDKLDEIRNNQKEIIKHLEDFHKINVNNK